MEKRKFCSNGLGLKKQLFADSLQYRCSKAYCKIHMKIILVPGSPFNKVAGPQASTLLRKDSSTGVFLFVF